ncbi:hypothetical protein P7K49_035590, partial [Saguinus oedipus]
VLLGARRTGQRQVWVKSACLCTELCTPRLGSRHLPFLVPPNPLYSAGSRRARRGSDSPCELN